MGIFSDILSGGASLLGGAFGGPIGAAAGSLLGGIIGGKSSSGTQQGGTQTVNRDPWAPAQPWLKQNLETGQALQNQYAANPFNVQQQAAYGNLASGNDYLNRLAPSLLQQFSQPTGFDRNNPTARPAAFNFSAPSVSPQMAQAYGGQMQHSMPSDGDSITQAYQDLLGRTPDAAGLGFYQNQMAGGMSLRDVRNEMSASPETAARRNAGMVPQRFGGTFDGSPQVAPMPQAAPQTPQGLMNQYTAQGLSGNSGWDQYTAMNAGNGGGG